MRQSRTAIVPTPAPNEGVLSTRSSAPLGDLPRREKERILSALIRVVAQQLAKPPDGKEVTHECS